MTARVVPTSTPPARSTELGLLVSFRATRHFRTFVRFIIVRGKRQTLH